MTYPCAFTISALLTTRQTLSIIDLSDGHLIDTKHIDRYHVLLPIAVADPSIALTLAILLDLALLVCIDLFATTEISES